MEREKDKKQKHLQTHTHIHTRLLQKETCGATSTKGQKREKQVSIETLRDTYCEAGSEGERKREGGGGTETEKQEGRKEGAR